MPNYVLTSFLWTFPYQLLYFADKFKKTNNFAWNCQFFEICWWNAAASTETSREKQLWCNFALHFTSYLSIALSKMLPHLKVIKYGNKLSVFRENDSHCLSNFLHTHICWNFDHIFRIYNQINYRIIWFGKVIIILTSRHKCCFSMLFPKKTHTLMPLGSESLCWVTPVLSTMLLNQSYIN